MFCIVNSQSTFLLPPLKSDMCGLGQSQSEKVILPYHFSRALISVIR